MIGDRLKRARQAAGLSLRDLESAIQNKVSAQAIGKYERNEMMPGSSALLALSEALRVSPAYLLSMQDIQLTGIDFRKAPHASSKEEQAVEAVILEQIERYLELEDLVPGAAIAWMAPNNRKFTIHGIEDAEEAADTLRQIWNLGYGPIQNLAGLLENKGIKVISLKLPEIVSGSKAIALRNRMPDIPVIVVNNVHNGERQRFTLAHELAHLVLEFIGLSENDQEKAADRFAGAFLMAKELVLELLGKGRSMISLAEFTEVKKVLRVSIAGLVVRCSQLGVITRSTYQALWDQIKVLGWNGPHSTEPHPLPPESPERMYRLAIRAVADGVVSVSKAAEILGIDVKALNHRLVPGGT